MAVDLHQVREVALQALTQAPDGDGLDELTATWVRLGVAAVATTLDNDETRRQGEIALELGATPEQLTELIILVSAIGMHTLHEGGRIVAELLRTRGLGNMTSELDSSRRSLLELYVGDDPYWARLEERLPGFLDALIRLSPEAFTAFVEFCAIPWRTQTLSPRTKEIVYLALDATPTHRYLPGVRLHLDNALRLGATRQQILEAVEIASQAGGHLGIG